MPSSKYPKTWVTSGPAAAMLGISRPQVYRLADAGLIRSMTLPNIKARRFQVSSLERFIAERSTPEHDDARGVELATA